MTIVEFLNARLDEEEQAARAAHRDTWVASQRGGVVDLDDTDGHEVAGGDGGLSLVDAEFMARHDPARVLREVAAKRSILTAHTPTEWPTGAPAICPTCARWDWEVAMGDDAATAVNLSPLAACGISASQLACPTHHGSMVPVEAGGELVAYLCVDCDTQMPAEWERGDVDHEHREVTEVATYMPEPVTRVECHKESP